jgi:hypothetical protein
VLTALSPRHRLQALPGGPACAYALSQISLRAGRESLNGQGPPIANALVYRAKLRDKKDQREYQQGVIDSDNVHRYNALAFGIPTENEGHAPATEDRE